MTNNNPVGHPQQNTIQNIYNNSKWEYIYIYKMTDKKTCFYVKQVLPVLSNHSHSRCRIHSHIYTYVWDIRGKP